MSFFEDAKEHLVLVVVVACAVGSASVGTTMWFYQRLIANIESKNAADESRIRGKCEATINQLSSELANACDQENSVRAASGFVLRASVRQTDDLQIRDGVTVEMRTLGLLRNDDSTESDGFPLPEGTRLRVLDLRGEWVKVELIDQ